MSERNRTYTVFYRELYKERDAEPRYIEYQNITPWGAFQYIKRTTDLYHIRKINNRYRLFINNKHTRFSIESETLCGIYDALLTKMIDHIADNPEWICKFMGGNQPLWGIKYHDR